MTYGPKVYKDENGDRLVVESGGVIDVKTGGIIRANGSQATAVTNATAASGGDSPTEAEHNAVVTKLNSVLAALRGAGIIAS